MKSIQLLYFLLVFSEKSSQFFVILAARKGLRRATFCAQKGFQKQDKKSPVKIPNQKENYYQSSSFQLQVFSFKFSKAVKRRRVKRTQDSGKQDSNAELAVKDREIKIGTAKQTAIKHMLNYCTFESYRALQCHLSFFSESSVNESVLSWKHLWPTSMPADGMFPSEAEEYARRAGAAAAAKLVPPRLMCFCSKNSFIYVYLI